MADLSQAQLLTRIRRGDQAALGDLLTLHQNQLYNTCLRMVGNPNDAAEVTQDALVKIIEHIGEFNGQCAIATWMTRITMNLAISHLRKRRLRLTVSMEASPMVAGQETTPLREQIPADEELSPESRVQQREMHERLAQAVAELDEEFRTVLVLRDIQEMDYQDVAEALGIPIGTVKSRLFRARLALRQKLTGLEPSRPRAPAATGS